MRTTFLLEDSFSKCSRDKMYKMYTTDRKEREGKQEKLHGRRMSFTGPC